jgi:hypothetical protein
VDAALATAPAALEEAMTATLHPIHPKPETTGHGAAVHACAWCGHEAATVPALLDHVVDTHLDDQLDHRLAA